jgi:hypothetical protein
MLLSFVLGKVVSFAREGIIGDFATVFYFIGW